MTNLDVMTVASFARCAGITRERARSYLRSGRIQLPLTMDQAIKIKQSNDGMTIAAFARYAVVSRPTVYAALKDGRLSRPLTEWQARQLDLLPSGRPRKERL